MDSQIEKKGYISVCDPACGAGATLIAAANNMKRSKYNFQNHVLFVGQDLDRVVGMMCYIQLSLLGCAGYICIGNTLSNPLSGHALFPYENEGQELWYMPMFQSDIWQYRRLFRSLGAKERTKSNYAEFREDVVYDRDEDYCHKDDKAKEKPVALIAPKREKKPKSAPKVKKKIRILRGKLICSL